jgi:hypothetical protein
MIHQSFFYLYPHYFTEVLTLKKKAKESRNRPGVAQRVSAGLESQISMTFGT